MKILFRTVVGSHLWRANHALSDTDVFECYVAPSADILRGTAYLKSESLHEPALNRDTARHEIGHVIDELLKGNINFVWGVTSPIVEVETKNCLKTLSVITKQNLSQASYYSIHGLAITNVEKYLKGEPKNEDGTLMEPAKIQKKRNLIARTLLFGCNLMNGKIDYAKVDGASDEDIAALLKHLDLAKTTSQLPEKPDPEPFRNYLYAARIADLEGRL